MGFIKNPHVAKVLPLLLQDKTTKHPIIWATDTYAHLGGEFTDTAPIRPEALLWHPELLRPRIQKSQEDQQSRTRKRAEVFTPAWLCNAMVNALDADWFSQDAVFTKEEKDGTWTTVEAPIPFPEGKSWRDYVDSRRLEMTCGEAPFLVSRYDASTGDFIASPKRRIGILDRKLRVVNENTNEEEEWLFWTFRAYEACYGYEVQGDSLLIARINLLLTFVDVYEERWGRVPEEGLLRKLANKISWNLWQMDGLTGTVPLGKPGGGYEQLSLFHSPDDTPIAAPCTLYDWRRRTPLTLGQIKEMRAMKKKLFDYVIGNPPYQEDFNNSGDNKNYAKPVYNLFMDAAYEVSDKVELIHPARFLFNVGSTPKDWNRKMLDDPHFKVLRYEPKSVVFFDNVDIKGGVAITYRDTTKDFGPISTFTAFPELNGIVKKAAASSEEESLASIVYTQTRFDLEKLYEEHPECRKAIGSGGKDKRLRNNTFDKIPLFTDEPQDESDIKILGLQKNKRVWKYIPARFIDQSHENLNFYKVFVPAANGSGALGEVLSTPVIGLPVIGHTQTFISLGVFETKEEAQALMKYIKTKFARAMLGVLKVTQHNDRGVWRLIPLQDFTPQSDIDWTQSVADIDRQLYKKYGLSPEEIDFIESHVKEMV